MATAPDVTTSPFRSKDKAVRKAGCERMVQLLEVEDAKLVELAQILTKRFGGKLPRKQALHIKTRRQSVATRLKSWARYAKQGYPHVPGAVEIPGYTPHRDR